MAQPIHDLLHRAGLDTADGEDTTAYTHDGKTLVVVYTDDPADMRLAVLDDDVEA